MPEVSVPESATPADTRPQTRRSAMLIALYVALSGWLFYQQATSWPHVGSWVIFGYIFLLPGILFQSFSLAYALRAGRPLVRRARTRLVTIPAGLLLAALLQDWGGTIAWAGFERAYAPFVAQVGASLPDACAGGAKAFEIPEVAAYNQRTGSFRPTAYLNHDGKRFVLGFLGGSADIDGSTFYYDSGTKEWIRFHNEDFGARDVHRKLIAGLPMCKLRPVPQ